MMSDEFVMSVMLRCVAFWLGLGLKVVLDPLFVSFSSFSVLSKQKSQILNP
jgi:hypothetical protein